MNNKNRKSTSLRGDDKKQKQTKKSLREDD